MGIWNNSVSVFVLVSAVGLGILYGFLRSPPPNPPKMVDGWFGYGNPRPESDTEIYDYRVSVPDEVLEDLKYRLDKSRFGDDLEDSKFHYGFSSEYLKEVADHWKTNFDWRAQEEILNSFPHFRTKIEGILLHFIRVLPPKGVNGRPLMMVHGWPGSVWEFHHILPLLTNPQKYGGQDSDAFEVIVPSIPGYGFSEIPKQKGFDIVATARIFHKLMMRLGHESYYVQGGDWGSGITRIMAQAYPEHVLGLHINFFFPPLHGLCFLHEVAAGVLPWVFLWDEGDRAKWSNLTSKVGFLLEETGYYHIQSTKPDTFGAGLNDSPVGLASLILEKFSTWTNPSWRDHPDGGLTIKWTLDDLLTNVMIYWVTGTITSSQRYYKENSISSLVKTWNRLPVNVPTALASFPNDIINTPYTFASYQFLNIVQTSEMPRGGHFAAFEEPELLANDIRNFVRKVERMYADQTY